MSEITLKNIVKVYDNGVKALSDVSLNISDREFLVIVGPSGCGKSTALKIIAGLEDPTEGEVYIDGKNVNKVPAKDRNIAMVFQNYALYPHMNVYENMAFSLKIKGLKKEEIDKRVKEVAKTLKIDELLKRKINALSGGQKQRVALGRAIVKKSKIFLFDEPLSNLDSSLRVQMRTEIASLHRSLNSTTVYVTHDQTEALTLADKIVVLNYGVVQQVGTPLELYNRPKNIFVASFIGSPPMNLIPGRIIKDTFATYVETEIASLLLPPEMAQKAKEYVGKEIILGLRAENLSYTEGSEAGKTIQGNAIIVENLGYETEVYTATGSLRIVARLEGDVSVKVGENITLSLDMSKAKFFDKETSLLLF